MNIVTLSGSIIGANTKHAINKTADMLTEKHTEHCITHLDLGDYTLPFSDGRPYVQYEGDAKFVTETIMQADAIIIGTPIFQASIPATLKNIFDLLPVNAFLDKVVSVIVTAGSEKHYLTVEHQLFPILRYMKAYVISPYVFIEEKDFLQTEIVNDDIIFRLEKLIEDTVSTAKTHEKIRLERESQYDF